MGCDIHLFAEKKVKCWNGEEIWISAEKWSPSLDYRIEKDYPIVEIDREDRFYSQGRNYNLFCALCGVRSGQFTGEPTRICDPKGLPEDVSELVLQQSEKYGLDGHSHSWNTYKEIVEFDWSPYGDTCDRFLEEVLPKMEKILNEKDILEVRIVYFFDN